MSKTKQKNKIRKSTKYVYMIVAIVLIIFSVNGLARNLSNENMKTTTEEIYNYTNKFNYDYKVNLVENKYINETQLTDKTLAYITDLMDNIDLDLNYEYQANKKSKLKYAYSIIGKMQAVYTKDGEEQKIMEQEEVILEEQKSEINSNKFNINKKLDIDLKEKNNLLNDFKQKMGMSIHAQYVIILKINVSTNVEGKDVNNIIMPCVKIDLAEKTTKIIGESDKEDTQYISKESKVNGSKNKVLIALDAVLLVIGLYILKYISKFRIANKVKVEFKQQLNRILKVCEDKIVQVNSKPVENPENLVYVKDFGEIVKVSEELFKPILYYLDAENDEAWFSVMTGNIVYRYILKD